MIAEGELRVSIKGFSASVSVRWLLLGSLAIATLGCTQTDSGEAPLPEAKVTPTPSGTSDDYRISDDYQGRARRELRRLETVVRQVCQTQVEEKSLSEFAEELEARSSLPEDIAAAVAGNLRPGFVKRTRNVATAAVEAACLEGIAATK
jgi:hypothetical protein